MIQGFQIKMTVYLKDIEHGIFANNDSVLESAELSSISFYREKNRVDIHLKTEGIIPFTYFQSMKETILQLTGSKSKIFVETDHPNITQSELRKYIEYYAEENPEARIFSQTIFVFHKENTELKFLFNEESEADRASAYIKDMEDFLKEIGFQNIRCICIVSKKESATAIPDVALNVIPQNSNPAPDKEFKKKSYYRTKTKDYDVVEIKDIQDAINDIQFVGDIFKIEEIEIRKTKKIIQQFSIFDGTDAILCKRFEGRGLTAEDLREIHEGDRVRVYGKAEVDRFSNELVFMPSEVEKIEKEKIVDNADHKRVELHMHTNMSEMDAVCDVNSIINYVYSIGHEGIVITDHSDVQSFVKAYNAAEKCKKKDENRSFKVGLGCEMNMVNDRLLIVRNGTEENLDDLEYIAFDLETTGLSCYYDHIIEFGAVKIKNQTVIDSKQMFIRPPVPIPTYISQKTNITNAMVKNAKSFADSIDEILDFIGNGVLVAHNASFDYHFLNEELKRIGRKPLKNVVIDTLDLSRAVLRERKAYRLGNISRNYHVAYDEESAHRADYDAEALAGVFMALISDARKKYGVQTIHDLQEKTQDDYIFSKVRRTHICVLAKNKEGLKDLYKLVTESNTKTLSVQGKGASEGGDVAAEPRILRSSLSKSRSNLLFGSACLNSDVFEMACNGDDERLDECMKFYDYIELQPLANYSTSIALGAIPSVERLKQVQKRIIDHAKKLGIPVVADSDAHYCSKDQKIMRDVYIMSQGVGGVTHPLYIRDEDLRHRTKNPDQHIRFTNEMVEAFSWLDDPELIDEIVIQNPHKIFDLLEDFRPVPAGTFPPFIEGSDDKLREICHNTAKKMYECDGVIPEIVTKRLDEELDNIIRNGFGVHYYIAHLLVKRSNDDGYVVGSRGSVGSSFTATMSGITEVNALPPHYLCPQCHYSEWIEDPEVKSGFDLPDKICPHCGKVMRGNGHNIPFQTFLGFNADKTPDIDLNFSNEYQAKAHAFIKEVFGEEHAFRAGTIGTVAEKTAYGYVSGYCEKMGITNMRRAMKDYLASGCQNVKRTTGQHPGGIIIIPENYDAEDFTPVQFPANDPNSEWKTTHYDFHDIHDNVLKFDILGHVDPTAMRLLDNIATVKPMDIPMNDPETLSLFYSDDALKADPRIYKKETGALGLPEFGTRTTRGVLEETRPHVFSDLVIISGLSHGTDVWAGNAQELVRAGHPLSEVIGCRDDIMTYLLDKNLEKIDAFKIMEDVRKGRGLREDQEKTMREHNVPDWYIDSCKKIKYMFPKAHAVAYVMMAVRIAWYKVHEPQNFYIQYLSLRSDAYEIETMTKGIEAIQARMQDIQTRKQDRNTIHPVSNKENALYDVLEVCEELYARGYSIGNIDMHKSLATTWCTDMDDDKVIIPPFNVLDGLGDNVAKSIVKAREEADFLSKEDLINRTQLSQTSVKKLEALGCLEGMQESNQMSLF